MKKDIEIPKVEGVYVAAVKEFNKDFGAEEWNAYLINDGEAELETVLIVTRGYDGQKQTSTMRHRLEKLPVRSFAKIEFLQEDVLALNNEFWITFFREGKMFEKKFIFRKNSINENAVQDLPVIPKKGVLVK